MRKLLSVVFLVFGFAVQAQQPPSEAEIARILGEIETLPGMRESLMRSGFEGENLDVALEQIGIILGDREIAAHLAQRILAAGRGDWATAQAAQGLIRPLLDRGMSHLSPRELSYFYQVEQTVLNAMPKRDCGRAFQNRIAPDVLAQRTARVAARLNTPALREYYRIQYWAAKYGVTRSAKPLSQALRTRVTARLKAELETAAEARPNGRALMRTMADTDRATVSAACEAGRFFLDVVMQIEPRARHEILLVLSEDT